MLRVCVYVLRVKIRCSVGGWKGIKSQVEDKSFVLDTFVFPSRWWRVGRSGSGSPFKRVVTQLV